MKTAGLGPKAGMTIFDKNWNKPIRKRGGYDTEHLDFTMRHEEPVLDFINAPSMKEAIYMLSRSTGLNFTTSSINRKDDDNDDDDDDDDDELNEYIQNHPFTTNEIKESLADLQVLNKSDFKTLLQWRTQMQDAIRDKEKRDKEGNDDDDDDGGDDDGSKADNDKDEMDSDQEEEIIQGEIEVMKLRRQKEKKRKLKKERAILAKRRKQAALGMDLNAFDITADNDQQIFSLSSIPTESALQKAIEINLDTTTDEQIFGTAEEQDDDIVIEPTTGNDEEGDIDEDDDNLSDAEKLRIRREKELNEGYNLYLQTTKDGVAKSGTKMAKRSKKLQREKVLNEAMEDQEMIMTSDTGLSYDAKAYAKLLAGKTTNSGKDGSDDSDDDDGDDDSDEDEDGFYDEPMTPAEYAAKHQQKGNQDVTTKTKKNKTDTNPLIHQFDDDEPASAKTSRWFSNPLFASIGRAVADTVSASKLESLESNKKRHQTVTEDDDSDDDNDERDNKRVKKTKKNSKADDIEEGALTADDILAMMPKTEKQKRHEKRLKQMDKGKRKEERRKRQLGENEAELQIVPADDNSDNSDTEKKDAKGKGLSTEQKKKLSQARDLIKAGMGKGIATNDDGTSNDKFEVVPANRIPDRPLPVMDDRKYDTDHEEYDSDDYAETLAIGTMLVRSKSKEKAFVDASYNRYSWNDPQDLPDWFMDDEKKHYRPQLPIPPALVAKIKEQMVALSVKPIKKVAEARARKNKRAKLKLAAAKKKAEAVAKSPDMTEAMKLKAISKALQGNSKELKKPGKQYVVAKRGRATKVGKGVKIVDKRLKSDTRAVKRIEKKKKNGGKLPKKRHR